MTPHISITSFGFLHGAPPSAQLLGAPPSAHLLLDLREHFRDPHAAAEMRQLTAMDPTVRRTVWATSGVREVMAGVARTVEGYSAGPTAVPVTVAIGCAGGRHRAPAVAMGIADRLEERGYTLHVTHRDLTKPVLNRAE